MSREGSEKPAVDRHLWEFRAMRDLLILLPAVLLFWLAYLLKEILLPIFVALLLAYLANPLITGARERWGISRPITIAVILALFLAITAGVGFWAAPVVKEQSSRLMERIPDYLQDMESRFGLDIGDLTMQVAETEEKEKEGEEGKPFTKRVDF